MSKEWSNLSKVVYRRTYSRNDFNHQEVPSETFERAIVGNTRGFDVSEEEIRDLRYYSNERKAGPAGRGWWFSGTQAHQSLGGVALNSCWGLVLSEIKVFPIAMDLLMLGGGVGASVQQKYVSKLPQVREGVSVTHKPVKDADYIVPDSREGWCDLLRRVLAAFFEDGKSFSYSTVCLRGAGEKISGFGGVSSGPLPLIKFVETLNAILMSRQGNHLRPIDASDLLCSIGEVVVSGNVRRSAILILGDPFDKDYLVAKRWDLGNIPSYRSCANFSVACDDIEDLHPLFWKTYEHGEPFGLVNVKNIRQYGRMGEKKRDNAVIVNPCQPSYATVLTPYGISTIGEVSIGDTIWDGDQFTTISNKWSTGIKPVYRYSTTASQFVGTQNHRVVSGGTKVEVSQANNIDWSVGPTPNYENLDPQDIMDGLVLGDGTIHKASNNKVLLDIGSKDQDYFDSEIGHLITKARPGIGPYSHEIITTIQHTELPKTYNREVPDRFFFGAPKKVRGFLRGLFTANGSVNGNRVYLKQASKPLIQQTQQMLSSLGIHSYITTNKGKAIEFSNGVYECKQSYDLNITSGRTIFRDLIGFIQIYKNDKVIEGSKPKYLTSDIKSIEYIEDAEVFDLTVESENHVYWTGGSLVSNCSEATLEPFEPCNLQEIFLPNLNGIEEFKRASTLLHRWGKRVTMEKYHHPEVQKVVDRNHRVGTSISGLLQTTFTKDDLNLCYQLIQEENINYSTELGIPPSVRTTVVKPSGTVSKMADVGAEGIHPVYSRYMIQRIRFASNDNLIPLLRSAGHHIEPVLNLDGTTNLDTMVVDFYMDHGPNVPAADSGFDTWKQLDTLLTAQKWWADQAVSVTVYYKKEEIALIKEWLSANLKYLKAISFLCHSGHGFAQAPKEAITAEQYDMFSSKIAPLSIDQIESGELESLECSGGSCPIK